MLGKHINHCEDSLTAAVFTHLLHLPVEVFWRILRNACHTTALPQNSGEPFSVEPWPNWDPKGTRNSDRVIPDLFIRFPCFDLIIEAKRWDGRTQDQRQWERELIAYTNQHGEEKRQVRMIAVGGLHSASHEAIEMKRGWRSSSDETGSDGVNTHIFVCPVLMCRWQGLLHQCKRLHDELSRLEYPTSQSSSHVRILDNVIDLFSWHGYQVGVWFTDIVANPRRLVLETSLSFDSMQFDRNNTKVCSK